MNVEQPARVSTVMVSYHTGDALFRAIQSVLNQSTPIELIVVDNGNPTAVIDRLKSMAAQDPRLKILTGHGNIGFSSANNLGVQATSGEYLLVLNPDSELAPDTVAKLITHAAKLQSPFMIGARILNDDGTDQRGCRRELLTPTTALIEALHLYKIFPQWRLNLHEHPIPNDLSQIPAISGACMFLSRQDFDLIGGFDSGYFLHVEDLDLCFRFRQVGGQIYFAPDVPVRHIGGTSSTTTDFVERHKTHGFIRYFHKNFSQTTPLILLWCLDIAIWGRYLLRKHAPLSNGIK